MKDISGFTVLDSDECNSKNANSEFCPFWGSVLERLPLLPFVRKAEWSKHLDLVPLQRRPVIYPRVPVIFQNIISKLLNMGQI